jgi:hypothetical protein
MATSTARIGGREMDGAQVFCLVLGAVLVVAGIVGFFYNATFTSDKSVHDDVFGVLSVNGWHNIVHMLTGVVTLFFAFRPATQARTWALVFGVVYLVVAVWGFVIGSGDSILSTIPVNTDDSVLHLILGVSGLAVYGLTAPSAAPHRPASAAT